MQVCGGRRVCVDPARVAARFNDRGRDNTQLDTFPRVVVAETGDAGRGGGVREPEGAAAGLVGGPAGDRTERGVAGDDQNWKNEGRADVRSGEDGLVREGGGEESGKLANRGARGRRREGDKV